MKFSLISTFTLVGAIVASPLGLTEKRDSSVVGTIASVVTNVQNVVTGSTANIVNAVNGINGNLEESLAVVGIIAENLNDITDILETSANGIAAVTTNAVGGVLFAAWGLSQAAVDTLATNVGLVADAVDDIRVGVQLALDGLAPAAVTALSAELAALEAGLAPFVTPLGAFAAAVQTSITSIGLTLTGLGSVTSALGTAVGNLLLLIFG